MSRIRRKPVINSSGFCPDWPDSKSWLIAPTIAGTSKYVSSDKLAPNFSFSEVKRFRDNLDFINCSSLPLS